MSRELVWAARRLAVQPSCGGVCCCQQELRASGHAAAPRSAWPAELDRSTAELDLHLYQDIGHSDPYRATGLRANQDALDLLQHTAALCKVAGPESVVTVVIICIHKIGFVYSELQALQMLLGPVVARPVVLEGPAAASVAGRHSNKQI
jgi:hypothetical protein